MKKIACVLLVDDSPSTNFYNKKIIDIENMADKVFDVQNGLEALDYILHRGNFKDESSYPRPNVIFLDINMPKMNGFEFMKEYQKLPLDQRTDILVVFLTTSNWSKDKLRVMEDNLVYDFVEKPLEPKVVKRIKDHYLSTPSSVSA